MISIALSDLALLRHAQKELLTTLVEHGPQLDHRVEAGAVDEVQLGQVDDQGVIVRRDGLGDLAAGSWPRSTCPPRR